MSVGLRFYSHMNVSCTRQAKRTISLVVLHGIHESLPKADSLLLDQESVTTRMRYYACITANKYAKFAGVSPARADDIAKRTKQRRHDNGPRRGETIDGHTRASDTNEVQASMKKASDMFRHGVAYNPMTGEHQHISRQTPPIALAELPGWWPLGDAVLLKSSSNWSISGCNLLG